jgi:alkylation response protein AidB-like acyl-CoA dehydrogenase
MHLDQDPELEDLRHRVQELVDEHRVGGFATAGRRRAGVRAPEADQIPQLRRWTAALYSADLIGVSWPPEYGGLENPHPLHEATVYRELVRLNAPLPIGAGQLAARALLDFGRPEQKEFFLPRMRAGEHIWCQLFSEPDAGSDLASLKTRAREAADGFVVSGQKVWTTNGQHADWGYLLARTDPDAPKHRGITAFAVDMRSAGVTVQPLREITGTSDFNEVFFDEVLVPEDNVIGDVGNGWLIANTSLAHERSGAGGGLALFRALDDLVDLAREISLDGAPAIEAADVRQSLGRFAAETQVNSLLSSYGESRALSGSGDLADAALSKIFFSELNLAISEYGMQLQGADGLRIDGDARALADGWWQDAFLYARAYTIAGGSNEVLRNVIADRALGLPREPSGRA